MVQEIHYESSRLGRIPVSRMAVPHAARALAALRREYGADVDEAPLARALAARAGLADLGAVLTSVPGFGGCRMLRDRRGRWCGAAWEAPSAEPVNLRREVA